MTVAELLTALQLAARLHVSPRTVRDWARRGVVPSVRPSPKIVRFEWEAVLEVIRSRGTGQRGDQR